MFSNVKARIVVVTLLLAGCKWSPGGALKVGEGNPPQGSVSVDMGKFSCLRDLDKSVESYFAGEMSRDRVTGLIRCMRSALERFQFLTTDAQDGNYLPESLLRFLNRQYLSDRPMPQSLMRELMHAKVLLLGGTSDFITRSELVELDKFLVFVEDQLLVNLPYIRIYTAQTVAESDSVTKLDLFKARQQVQLTIAEFAGILQSRGVPYSVASFTRLIHEGRAFLRSDENLGEGLTAEQIVSVFQATKGIITGADGDVIYPQDWAYVADWISAGYGMYLNYAVRMKDRGFTVGPALDSFVVSVRDALTLLDRAIERSTGQVITFAAIERLLRALQSVGLFSDKIRISSLTPVINRLISVGLQNPNQINQTEVRGLGLSQLLELRSEFNLWADGQKYLSDNARGLLGLKALNGQGPAFESAVQLMQSLDFTKSLLGGVERHNRGGHDISDTVRNIRPLYRDGDERVFILPRKEAADVGVQNSLHGLTRMNLMRSLSRILIRSFAAPERVRSMAGITEDELNAFYRLVKPFGEDLHLMDPRKPNTVSRYFVDGNMFTFSGDGFDDRAPETSLLTIYETMELLAILWSSHEISAQVFTDIKGKCLKEGVKLGPPDVFGQPKLDRACFFKHLRDRDFAEFDNMPRMVNALRKLPMPDQVGCRPEEKDEDRLENCYVDFLISLESIAKVPGEDLRYIENAEVSTMVGTMQYVEVLFATYDANANDLLESYHDEKQPDGSSTNYEIFLAYKRFAGFVDRAATQKTAKGDQPGKRRDIETLKGVFAFLVKNKRMPVSSGDMASVLGYDFSYFNDDPAQFEKAQAELQANGFSKTDVPQMSIDRAGVMKLLRLLAESGATRPK